MIATPSLTAIVLAGGQSRRMGDDNKLLLPLAGRPVLGWVVEAFRTASVDDIVVVTGADRTRVTAALANLTGIRVTYNPAFHSGMASSIRCGVRAARSDTSGYALCPGDLPLLRSDTVNRLKQAFSTRQAPCIVYPTHGGRHGHPVLFDRSFHDELLALQGDRGAREVLRRHEQVITRVPVADEGIFRDVDTPEAFRKLREHVADESA